MPRHRRSRLTAPALLAALLLPAPAAAGLTEVARLVITAPDPAFGGLSGLILDTAGETFTAVGDRGLLVTGRIRRDAGVPVAVEDLALRPLLDRGGKPVHGMEVDAEDIAPDGAAGFFVAFEGEARIWHYPAPDATAERTAACRAFPTLQINSGLEALARGPDGTLYAIPERSGEWSKPFPAYRIRDGRCLKPFPVPRSGAFLVTGATVGPDGRLYIVERDFALLAGFATRIRSFAIGAEGFEDERLLLETGHGAIGNLEGIAAWSDPEGRTRLTLIADDNLSPWQETVLIEFVLTE
jgi:hypothetical protein